MLTETTEAADAGPYHRIAIHPGGDDMERLRGMLAAAERPFLLAGGAGWSERAKADIEAFAAASHIPVGTPFRRSEEHTSELQSLMSTSYAVFWLKKKKQHAKKTM